jgi:SAM-dependent methyltransferase
VAAPVTRRQLGSWIQRLRREGSGGRDLLSNPFASAKLLPLSAGRRHALLNRPSATVLDDDLPTPPRELWERWGHSLESYLSTGRADVESMLAILEAAGATVDPLAPILDFGCAEGRMLRFFPRTNARELWGVDINAERIAWAQQHLAPPFRLATITTAPHLPFEDNYFDLVYCLSVFTHISDLADAWFLELLRVLRPGGHVYLTIHDEHTVELLLGRYRKAGTHETMVALMESIEEQTRLSSQNWVYFAIDADPGAQVFYNAEYLVGKWSPLADCLTVRQEASDYQTALVFRKRPREPARARLAARRRSSVGS